MVDTGARIGAGGETGARDGAGGGVDQEAEAASSRGHRRGDG